MDCTAGAARLTGGLIVTRRVGPGSSVADYACWSQAREIGASFDSRRPAEEMARFAGSRQHENRLPTPRYESTAARRSSTPASVRTALARDPGGNASNRSGGSWMEPSRATTK